MAEADKAPTPPTKQRQQEMSPGEGGEGQSVSRAPTDKPVMIDEPYVGVDDIYRNHADHLNEPMLADEGDELMEESIKFETERRASAEQTALLGSLALAPNPNLEGVEPTDPERAEEFAKVQERQQQVQQKLQEQAKQQLQEAQQAEADMVKAQAESLRQAADTLEQSIK